MQAAAHRARKRREQERDEEFEGAGMSYLRAIEAAEATYDELPPELAWTEGGIMIEPFHLKREREEGYFDEEGNYVELKEEEGEEEDAWADALTATKVDGEWLARISRARDKAAAAAEEAEEAEELDPESVRQHKQALLELLLPGETVMPSPVRQAFDCLTESSSALMEAGHYGVHSQTREQIASGLEAGPSRSAGAGGVAAAASGASASRRAAPGHGAQQQQRWRRRRQEEGGGGGAQQLAVMLLVGAAGGGEGAVAPAAEAAARPAARGDEGLGGPQPAAGQPAPAPAVDADTDLFSDEPVAAGAAGDPPAAPHGGGEEKQLAPMADVAMDDAPSPGEAATGSGARSGSGQHEEPEPAAVAAAAGQAPPSQSQGDTSDGPPELDGFALDPGTGYYYNSAIGCYFDPATRLYGDAASGRWYRARADGSYEAAG
eukprot:scaffold5.g952.t1